jgi:aminoglycoside phosphotransferase (APT) family kinase protein
VNDLPVQDLLDRATLAADARWPGAGITDLEPLPGGISSLTFAARLTHSGGISRRVVLKVAPPGLPAVRNRDVLRQARILHALHGVPGVRVPAVLIEDAGTPPFFLMEFVAGHAYEPKKDLSSAPPDAPTVIARVRAAARMLARLHSAQPADLGLAGEPELSVNEELERWSRLFGTAGDELRSIERELHRRLAANIPRPVAARVLHGDYRIGNIQFDGPRLAAIIDWEIWSLGDPRTDLAWLMAYTDPVQRFHDERDAANQAAADAVPHRSEVLAEYLAVRPIDTAELDWFLAYCYYKIASTTAALAKRNRRLDTPDPALERAAVTIPAVIERGLEVMEGAHAR